MQVLLQTYLLVFFFVFVSCEILDSRSNDFTCNAFSMFLGFVACVAVNKNGLTTRERRAIKNEKKILSVRRKFVKKLPKRQQQRILIFFIFSFSHLLLPRPTNSKFLPDLSDLGFLCFSFGENVNKQNLSLTWEKKVSRYMDWIRNS